MSYKFPDGPLASEKPATICVKTISGPFHAVVQSSVCAFPTIHGSAENLHVTHQFANF